jgi:hypothetical protein
VPPPLAVKFNVLLGLKRFRGNVGAPVRIKARGTGVGLAQHPNSEIVVHALAAPAGGGGVGVDVNAELGVGVFQLLPVAGVGSGAANDLEARAAALLGFDGWMSTILRRQETIIIAISMRFSLILLRFFGFQQIGVMALGHVGMGPQPPLHVVQSNLTEQWVLRIVFGAAGLGGERRGPVAEAARWRRGGLRGKTRRIFVRCRREA